MFSVTEAEATAIRTAYPCGGEFAAAVELRRLFPGISDMANAQRCARVIARGTPLDQAVPEVRGRDTTITGRLPRD